MILRSTLEVVHAGQDFTSHDMVDVKTLKHA